MYTTTLIKAFALYFFTALISAQESSAPFYLTILTTKKKLNGSFLSACHVAAAEESLCLLGPSSSHQTFLFNTTYTTSSPPSTQGYLIFPLPIGLPSQGGFILSSPSTFTYHPSSNIATPLFTPSDNSTATEFSFCPENFLSLLDFTDPSHPYLGQSLYYRFHICDWNVNGYTYQNLVWVMGTGRAEAQNCEAVNVTRVFV